MSRMPQSSLPPTSLPLFDRRLLHAVERIVPAAERNEWSRAWQAELWHMHRRNPHRGLRAFVNLADFSIAVLRDALWLRADCWSRAWSGTAALCLASLLALCALSALIALTFEGSWHALVLHRSDELYRSLIAAPLVVFVAFATASRRHTEPGAASKKLLWIRRQLFFALKIAEILVLASLLSTDLFQPIHASLPMTADLFQILSFVFVALIGLRWAFLDQGQRCKHCLRTLATPSRVGRPSHNLLEWNGTELNCRQGHGLLSIPEMETSWCQSSEWVSLTSG